jgi:primosomal protein N' (replication factor Y)
MTWHAGRFRLVCHYCMAEARRPELCPTCKASPPVALGAGTERIEDWVRTRFPEIVVVRMDSDTMLRRESYERVLGAFRRREIDILVGTQMIAKGLDFPDVTLVGVISADTGLFQPDFRAAERCYQILAQVAGRAGRGDREGLVVFQTLCPESEPIQRAARLEFAKFAEVELAARRELGYPPFGRLIRIIAESTDASLGRRRICEVADLLRRAPQSGYTTLGPAPAPLTRVRGRARFHVLVKCPSEQAFLAARTRLESVEARSDRRQRLLVDVDPFSML